MRSISINDWDLGENVNYKIIDGVLKINNNTPSKISIPLKEKFCLDKTDNSVCYINFKGKPTNSGGYLTINQVHNIPINSDVNMPLDTPIDLDISLIVAANSSVEFSDITFDFEKNVSFIDEIDKNIETLIIVPDYPSYNNLYACAFAHSRNKEYVKNGLKVQVFAVNSYNWFETRYERDKISVIKGTYKTLKQLLSTKHFKVVIAHFVDENLYPIFDGNIFANQKLIFICHGPETVYRYLVNKVRPYFTKPYPDDYDTDAFKLRDEGVKRYAQMDNVEWVFVSDWLKNFSEEQQGFKFKHSRVINNIIDETLFPYTKRNPEDRKKILMVRKFDNICQHSIDQVVMAILELSRRDFFNDLTFDIYGDGNFYDELVEPIRQFENVHLIRSFIPNEKLNDIYKEHGLMLLPSRHDAHAVSMGESASTGLVVLGSTVTSNPYFMNEKENHTLADPEDYVELANIIERMYKNPEEFLRVSENMATFTRQFSKKNTVMKEIDLIKKSIIEYSKKDEFISKKAKKPVLTIGIPAYNVEKYIEKCVISILKCKNADKVEILVINDGSKDDTSKIVKKIEKKSDGILRLINKENGGHGSTINRAIKEAKGKYFRLVDGDDWVFSDNLDKLIDIMEKSDSDVILTTGSYDYVEDALPANIIDYDMMIEGKIYKFDDLTYKNFGFKKYGPLLTTGNYKTQILKDSGFSISEKKPYVDMEFNAFSIRKVDTIVYYDLNIYRYLIGREGQTISPEYWKKKYKDHISIIFSIIDYLNNNDYNERKKEYVLNNILAPMIDSQVFMFDKICKWDELDEFLHKLKEVSPTVYNCGINYINELNGNCALIIKVYKKYVKSNRSTPIIIPGVCETINDYNSSHIFASGSGLKHNIKRLVKAILPYGVVRYIQRKRS